MCYNIKHMPNPINDNNKPKTILEELREVRMSFSDVREAQLKTDEKIKELSESMAKTDEQMKKMFTETNEFIVKTITETNDQIRKNEKKLSDLGINFGGLQQNLGMETEELFHQYLSNKMSIGSIKFDEIIRNLHDKKREYDIIMDNCNYIAIIEIKRKATEIDIDNLIKKALPDFKETFKMAENKKIILAIASPIITDKVRKKANGLGVVVMTQNGENVKVEDENVDKISMF